MKVVCAWCKKVLSDDGKHGTSDGICQNCLKIEMAEIEKRRKQEKKK